jgi:hypothetical protein
MTQTRHRSGGNRNEGASRLIPRNVTNADSTAQITTAGTSLANALFFDFTGNQMRTLVPAAGLGTYPISGSIFQGYEVG